MYGMMIFPHPISHSFAYFLPVAMMQISAGFQQVKIGERGGRRRDFHDSGVHTRQLMEHVKESKTGNTIFNEQDLIFGSFAIVLAG